jgi:hypothetical protein
VTPGCSSRFAVSANDLKPLRVRALRNIGSRVRRYTWQLGHQ